MIRCLTIAALLLWLAKPSCVICCGVDSPRLSRWQAPRELLHDDFPPSEPKCCLLDADKGNPTRNEQPGSMCSISEPGAIGLAGVNSRSRVWVEFQPLWRIVSKNSSDVLSIGQRLTASSVPCFLCPHHGVR